jgi:hypothetical protein
VPVGPRWPPSAARARALGTTGGVGAQRGVPPALACRNQPQATMQSRRPSPVRTAASRAGVPDAGRASRSPQERERIGAGRPVIDIRLHPTTRSHRCGVRLPSRVSVSRSSAAAQTPRRRTGETLRDRAAVDVTHAPSCEHATTATALKSSILTQRTRERVRCKGSALERLPRAQGSESPARPTPGLSAFSDMRGGCQRAARTSSTPRCCAHVGDLQSVRRTPYGPR